jgi:hypothetical protein
MDIGNEKSKSLKRDRRSRVLTKKVSKFVFLFVLVSTFCLFLRPSLSAQPGSPPPPGKVWVKGPSGWILVVAPPADGPYVWAGDHWERITEIPPGKVWVPPHWGENGWVPGHWKPVVYPHKRARWIPGHWTPEGRWVPGHWKDVVPPPHKKKRVWVPGHRGPHGRWIPGHWR